MAETIICQFECSLSAQSRISVSIPLQIQFVDPTVAPRCCHITNIEVFDDEDDHFIPSEP